MTVKKQWHEDLPDINKWKPRGHVRPTLASAFLRRCKDIEQDILRRAQSEREMNIDNFDSGSGIEDIIREELRELCPGRYSIRAGVIDDREGYTAGDFEIIITNDTWFTPIKSGATKESRRIHFPIEAVYAVIEVKQTLNYHTLDQAMEKLVKCHRLQRPPVSRKRIMENCQLNGLPIPDITINTLYSGIIATDLEKGISEEDIIRRFLKISERLQPQERVRALCMLGQRTVGWGFPDPSNPNGVRHLTHELNQSLVPIDYPLEEAQCVLYPFICELFSHLFNSVLGPESYYEDYGYKWTQVKQIEVEDIN